jgi:5-methylcytosine-specific restriction protein A
MPSAAPHGCAYPGGCAALVAHGKFCEAHQAPRESQAEYDRRRQGDPARIYNRARWQALRLMVIRRDPVCKDCGNEPSNTADHVVPVRDGGAKWDMANLQGLCAGCHNRKTQKETRKAGARI